MSNLKNKREYQVRLVDKIDEAIEKRMTKELIAYEAEHGIDVNCQRFSVIISMIPMRFLACLM